MDQNSHPRKSLRHKHTIGNADILPKASLKTSAPQQDVKHSTDELEAEIRISPARFLNRELSWLDFNARVVAAAQNPAYPLLERLRFVSISASNLDEFHSVRVAGLIGQARAGVVLQSSDGMTPSQQLTAINHQARDLIASQQSVFESLEKELIKAGIIIAPTENLGPDDRVFLDQYFMERVFPILTPLAIDPAHPFPFVQNMGQVLALKLMRDEDNGVMRALIPLPGQIERFIRLPSPDSNQIHFVKLECLVKLFMNRLFPGFTLNGSGLFRLIRDTDVEFEDEAEDLVRSYESALRRRRRGAAILLTIATDMPEDLRQLVIDAVDPPPDEIFLESGLLGLVDLKQLIVDDRPDLLFSPYTPRFPERIRDFGGDCFAAIRAKDIIVHHPFESFDVVVQFLRQAAADPNAVAIKQTLYRTSHDSPIVKALIEAAETGKTVTAMVELRARFDEEANIRLARSLEAAGVQVVYGFLGLKTHAKLSLVVRREGGTMRAYAHFGTGNYHPITARIYTDLSFFTCDPALTRDAARLFNYMTGYARPETMDQLVFSPLTTRRVIGDLIKSEIEAARSGKRSGIWIKLNSLVDERLIDQLYEASSAGVPITCVIRGICCLRPGVPGLSETIQIKSIIGRFLEHSRICVFANYSIMPSRQNKVFISSADWMARNMDGRVETFVPIHNPTVHAQVLDQIMAVNLRDDVNSWSLGPGGNWQHNALGTHQISSHDYFMTNPSLSGRGSALHGPLLNTKGETARSRKTFVTSD